MIPIRKVATSLAIALGVALAVAPAAQAAPQPAPIAPAAVAPAPDLAASCQKTFHARPTTGGLYTDPCSHNGGTEANYSWSIGLKWHWDCTGGCHINAVLAVMNICRRTDGEASGVSSDAISLNIWATKVAFLVFDLNGDEKPVCDELTSPFVTPVKGCGSGDRPLGVYPQVTSIMARGRGTLYASAGSPLPDFSQIPGWGLFDSHESYYLVGRGGKCS